MSVFLLIAVLILWFDIKYYAKRQKRLIKLDRREDARENYDQNEDQQYVYVPNLKLWGFLLIVGLVILLVPLIYILMNKIYNVPNCKYWTCHWGRFVAWHYLNQIFFMLFIIGLVGLVAYMLIKVSKDD